MDVSKYNQIAEKLKPQKQVKKQLPRLVKQKIEILCLLY